MDNVKLMYSNDKVEYFRFVKEVLCVIQDDDIFSDKDKYLIFNSLIVISNGIFKLNVSSK